MSKIVKPLRVPALALLVGLGGVGLALLYFKDRWLLALLSVAVLIIVAGILDGAGHAALPDSPEVAHHLLGAWVLIPIGLAALAAAAVVVVTVELTLPETPKPTTETKELVSAVSAGITSFLTAGFIAWTEDDKDSTLADHVKEAFQAKYTRPDAPKKGAHVFLADSAGERWVFGESFGGAEGWGGKARRKRAAGIATELRSGNSDPRS